jgi:hypothetical protein
MAPSDFLQGMHYALLEGRFLFDFVHEDDLEVATLKKRGGCFCSTWRC